MTIELANSAPQRSRFGVFVGFLFNLFHRVLAIAAFLAALYMWTKLVGIWDGAENRFDTMSLTLKIYTLVLAVILPVTSVGLWTTLAWGRVIWFLLIGFQVVFILRFFSVVEYGETLILFHAITLVTYVVFQSALFFIDKKE